MPSSPSAFFDSGAELHDTLAVVNHHAVPHIEPKHTLLELCRMGGYWGYRNPTHPELYGTFDFGKVLIDEPAKRFAEECNLSVSVLGLRAEESAARRKNAGVKGELYQVKDGLWHLCPLTTWNTDAVWAYIADRELVYNAAYDKMTALGIPRERQRISTTLGIAAANLGRYVYLRQLDPDLYNRLAQEFPRIALYT